MSRLLLFLGLALLLGGATARALFGTVPRLRTLVVGLGLLFVGAALSVYLPLAELGAFSGENLLGYLTVVGAGRATLLLLLAATLLLLATLHRLPGPVLLGLAGTALWGMSGIGHGGSHGQWVRGLHALHAGAMALWLGGLWALLSIAPSDRLTALRRFSPLAAGCLTVIVLTGTGMSLSHVPALALLTQTEYGQTLLLKLLAFGVALPVAASVRRSLAGGGPRRRLWLEFGVLLLVLLLTARLGGLPLVHGFG